MSEAELLEELRAVSRQRRANRGVMFGAAAGISVLFVAFLGLAMARGREPDWSILIQVVPLLIIGLALSERHKRALRMLRETPSQEAVPLVIEVLDSPEKDVRALARELLERDLPNLPSDYRFDSTQAHRLATDAARARTPGYVNRALEALGKHGGSESIAAMEQLAQRYGRLQGADAERASTLAYTNLANLRLRLAQERIQAESEAEKTSALSS